MNNIFDNSQADNILEKEMSINDHLRQRYEDEKVARYAYLQSLEDLKKMNENISELDKLNDTIEKINNLLKK